MSDDEEYFEWEEEYLFEEVVPDIVDELAVTSYYEPALYDDPAVEVEDYFSDWDYYSDDYYDDDPTAEQGAERAGKIDAPRTATATRQAQPRIRRRVPRPRSSLKPDVTSFQGVVWKTPSLEKDQEVAVQTYEPGHGDKVALLENWREVFKSAQPALDKSRLRKRRVRDSRRSKASPSADEAMPSDDDQTQDSSNQMSDVSARGILRERDADAGDASNTTPELIQSPDDAPNRAAPAQAKRGRKRKAESAVEDVKTNGPVKGSPRPQPRSKRVATRKGDGKEGASHTSSGPVRRSARSRK